MSVKGKDAIDVSVEQSIPQVDLLGSPGGGDETKVNPSENTLVDGSTRPKRSVVMTEKGKQHLLESLKSLVKKRSKRLEKQIAIIDPLLDSTNVDIVNTETANLDRMYSELTETHVRLCEALDGDEDGDEHTAANVALDEVDSKYFAFKEKVCSWQIQRDLETALHARDERSSVSSGSAGSTSSRKSKRSNKSRASSRASSNGNPNIRLDKDEARYCMGS